MHLLEKRYWIYLTLQNHVNAPIFLLSSAFIISCFKNGPKIQLEIQLKELEMEQNFDSFVVTFSLIEKTFKANKRKDPK